MWFHDDIHLNNLRTRSSEHFQHDLVTVAKQKTCVYCCQKCEIGMSNDHYRHGCKTFNKCGLCQVYLCREPRKVWDNDSCWDRFHKAKLRPNAHPFVSTPSDASEPNDTPQTQKMVDTATPVKKRAASNQTPSNHYTKRARLSSADPVSRKKTKKGGSQGKGGSQRRGKSKLNFYTPKL